MRCSCAPGAPGFSSQAIFVLVFGVVSFYPHYAAPLTVSLAATVLLILGIRQALSRWIRGRRASGSNALSYGFGLTRFLRHMRVCVCVWQEAGSTQGCTSGPN